ncbi:MAG: T9SS type A sorting domain-containing protein [Flavobacteriales bacterium]
MKKFIITILGITLFIAKSYAQYPENESGTYQDLLTPAYYSTPIGGAFRVEINKFVYYARIEPFRHPLEDSFGVIPSYSIPSNGTFSAGKGPGNTGEHHKANDMHVGSNDTNVTMYAAIDGYVNTYYSALKYRDYLSITKDIKDSSNNILGKMVVIYGHLELILDSLDGLLLNGQYVNQGDVVSKHLYSGTVGGPHLHFEIRYYRAPDFGTEDYYGFIGANLTDPSAGIWTYGLWDPNVGYGFAQLENHLSTTTVNVEETVLTDDINILPNPSSGIFNIDLGEKEKLVSYTVFSMDGRIVLEGKTIDNKVLVDMRDESEGVYFLKISDDSKITTYKIIKQ